MKTSLLFSAYSDNLFVCFDASHTMYQSTTFKSCWDDFLSSCVEPVLSSE